MIYLLMVLYSYYNCTSIYLGVQDDVSLLLEQFLRKRNEQKGSLKLHLSFQILTHCLIINVVFVIFVYAYIVKKNIRSSEVSSPCF
jgi:hypothetical protein